jgi:catechol 2,3-dioxygenase-like lactoylglutathione lyase family enzyme
MIDRIDHVVLNCRDVEATAAWYERVLGLEREVFGSDRRLALKFGRQKLNLRGPMISYARSPRCGAPRALRGDPQAHRPAGRTTAAGGTT